MDVKDPKRAIGCMWKLIKKQLTDWYDFPIQKIGLPGLQNRPTGPTTERVFRIILNTKNIKRAVRRPGSGWKGAYHIPAEIKMSLYNDICIYEKCALPTHINVRSQAHVRKLYSNYDETRKDRSMKTDDKDISRSVLLRFLFFILSEKPAQTVPVRWPNLYL